MHLCSLASVQPLVTTKTELDFWPMADSLETFAGEGQYTLAKSAAGWAALRFEKNDDPIGQNILADLGFVSAISMAPHVHAVMI